MNKLYFGDNLEILKYMYKEISVSKQHKLDI